MEQPVSFDEWLQVGLDHGFCTPPVCEIHDGLPTTAEEDEEFINGNDPCIHIMRLFESPLVKELVEQNHSPSSGYSEIQAAATEASFPQFAQRLSTDSVASCSIGFVIYSVLK